MADELLHYTATTQGTAVKRRPEVRAENAVDGGVSMISSLMQVNNDSQSNRKSESRGN